MRHRNIRVFFLGVVLYCIVADSSVGVLCEVLVCIVLYEWVLRFGEKCRVVL